MRTLSAVLILSATVAASAAEPKVVRDVPYAEPKSERRMLDVYAPAEGRNHPVVVWLHGGGWRQGDKTLVHRKPQAFVDRGFVFVSVNYRFVPQVQVPEMTGDVAKAVRWVRDHAAEHGGDPTKIVVAGHSAGAHLAALVCTDPRYLAAEGLSPADVAGCIPVDTAVYDVPKQVADSGPVRGKAYAATFGDDPAGQRNLSPIAYVARDRRLPAFLILHVASRPDATAQSLAFAKALADAGVRAQTFAGENKTHGSINSELGLPDDPPTRAVFAFLDEILIRGKTSSE